MPSFEEMDADLKTAQAHGDWPLVRQIASHIQQQTAQTQGPQRGGAIAGEQDLGPAGNAALAAGIHAVHQIPLLGDLGLDAGRFVGNAVRGQGFDPGQAVRDTQATIQSAQQNEPIASTVGGAVGGTAAALVGGEALKAGGLAVPAALRLQQGQNLLNAGRLAVGGAAAGGVQSGLQAGGEQVAQGNIAEAPGAALNAIPGGVLAGAAAGPAGAVLGKVIGGPMSAGAGLPGKTAMALSKVFGESANDLQTAWRTFQQETGRAPTMTELSTLKQLGMIDGAAKSSAPITQALRQASAASDAARSAQMQSTFSEGMAGQPTAASPQAFENLRTQQGNIDYPSSRAMPDFNVSTEDSPDFAGASPADHLAATIVPQAGLKTPDRIRIVAALQNGTLSSADAQTLRSALGAAAGRGQYSAGLSSARADLDHILSMPGNEASAAALNKANANSAALATAGSGAEHGASILGSSTPSAYTATAEATGITPPGTGLAPAGSGHNGGPAINPEFAQGMQAGANDSLSAAAATPRGAVNLAARLGSDDNLHAKLAATFGQDAADALRVLGKREDAAASALDPYSNRLGPSEESDTPGLVTSALHGIATAASHGGWAAVHAVRAALPLMKVKMAPAVQEQVAKYLSDPAMTTQGINLLRKAGASSAALRKFAISIAGAAGGLTQ